MFAHEPLDRDQDLRHGCTLAGGRAHRGRLPEAVAKHQRWYANGGSHRMSNSAHLWSSRSCVPRLSCPALSWAKRASARGGRQWGGRVGRDAAPALRNNAVWRLGRTPRQCQRRGSADDLFDNVHRLMPTLRPPPHCEGPAGGPLSRL
jgi:hypothetical protein